ncbi:hypothetical protein QJS10_CPA10g00316 [Acorus calamus]|uniref:Uncharacterized protein n=1 Tax=Acorus calamus TaxID=4465 RepID=A0AAV9DZ54_ACOCL|nr:hypothetical protein QJS10_CPA10g00316 [Acorus calamus]
MASRREAKEEITAEERLRREAEAAAATAEEEEQQQRRGVLESLQEGTKSMLKAVQGTYEHAKEATIGKASETAEKTGETKDSTMEKAREGRQGEGKGRTASAARRAVDYLTGKKEDAKHEPEKVRVAAKERMEETEGAAREKMEGLHLRSKEVKDEAGRKAEEAKDVTAQTLSNGDHGEVNRGSEGKGGIFNTIKEKFTGPGEATVMEREERHGKDGGVHEVASKLKESDQMTGQTFNDVGKME